MPRDRPSGGYRLNIAHLPAEETAPAHVAIIMDGNGRWAQQRMLPRSLGHVRGAAVVRKVVQWCADRGIRHLTVFAFSTENWGRPPPEVSFLMKLFVRYCRNDLPRMLKHGVRLRVLGDLCAVPEKLVQHIQKAEAATAKNERLQLNVALNYGGRQDIIQALQKAQREHPKMVEFGMADQVLPAYLSTAHAPEPDLLIRTGGESRVSNFLLWQLTNAAFYVAPVLWPDFDEEALEAALHWYRSHAQGEAYASTPQAAFSH